MPGVLPHPSPYRILVVDDDPDMRAYLRLCLVAHFGEGTILVEAEDGVDALDQAQRSPPDLIITDLIMPRLDGYGLCHAIRADPLLHLIPILLISGAAPHLAEREEGEADGFLPKTFNAHSLTQQVQYLLDA